MSNPYAISSFIIGPKSVHVIWMHRSFLCNLICKYNIPFCNGCLCSLFNMPCCVLFWTGFLILSDFTDILEQDKDQKGWKLETLNFLAKKWYVLCPWSLVRDLHINTSITQNEQITGFQWNLATVPFAMWPHYTLLTLEDGCVRSDCSCTIYLEHGFRISQTELSKALVPLALC